MSKKEKSHLFDNPRNIQIVVYGLFAVCTVVFLADFALHRHVDHPAEAITGFYAVYGFSAYSALVLIARELRKILMRKEDYYDEQ